MGLSSLKEKLQTAWTNRNQIAEGFYNAYVHSSQEVKEEALRRLSICRENKCGYYDPNGTSERAVFKGKESCGGCGCDLYAKAHAMSASCYLADFKDPEHPPLWEAVLTPEQETEINTIARKKWEEQQVKQNQK